jgi:integrase
VILNQSDLIVSNEMGKPIYPETYSAWFRRVSKEAGLSRIVLCDARRTTGTVLATEYGVPGDTAASYLGHDPVTYHRVYVRGIGGMMPTETRSFRPTPVRPEENACEK